MGHLRLQAAAPVLARDRNRCCLRFPWPVRLIARRWFAELAVGVTREPVGLERQLDAGVLEIAWIQGCPMRGDVDHANGGVLT